MPDPKSSEVSLRTKAALAAAKARGVKLGVRGADNLRPSVEARKAAAEAFAATIAPTIRAYQARGLTHRAMAAELNAAGIAAPRGGAWTHGQVQRLLERLGSPAPASAAPAPLAGLEAAPVAGLAAAAGGGGSSG